MDYLNAFLGGLLIGVSSLLLLLFHGRVLGVSGIIGGCLQKTSENKTWRWLFLAGIWAGGLVLLFVSPTTFQFTLSRSIPVILIAGLLVGFGTRLGGGCTSGHGVCGISRLSVRSMVATLVFMACGALTVFVMGQL